MLPIAKENESVQIEKTHQVYLGEKREGISAIRNTFFQTAENLGLVPLLEPYSDQDSTMEQELTNCHAVYDIATYKKRRVFVTIKKYSVNKPPYIQIRLYVSYFLYVFKYHYFEISASDQWALSLKSKMYSWKNIFSNYIELAKNQKGIGRFSWSLKSFNRKLYFEPCFQLLKKMNREKSKKNQQVYLGEKGERISAKWNTVTRDAENLGLVRLLESYSVKDSTMEQELAHCHAVYDIATYKKRKMCVTIKKYSVNKPPYIQIRLYISYFLYIFKYHYFEISATNQWALSLKTKMYSWKNIFSNYIELAKNQKRIGRFS